MQKQRSSETPRSILHPSTPPDIAHRSQRQRIVDAMVESCAEKTYAATTITDIVARARISRTTFYKHFDDKRACFDAAVDYCVDELRGIAVSARSPDDSPGDAARKATSAVVAALAERSGFAQLLAGDAMAVDPAVIARYRRATIPALGALWGKDGKAAEAHTDPHLAFGQAQVLILNHLATGRSEQLPELLPELVYLAVSPYGGHEEALEQSRRAGKTKIGSSAAR